jgi:hydroxyacyl-ACP dehydratase HTD2-like protein with hotdog domain
MATFSDWIGRERRRVETICAGDLARMAAVLDREIAPAEVPPLWWWASFPDTTPASRLGEDGHAALGDFLPPIAAPRRMFAAGRAVLRGALAAETPTELVERILAVDEKTGRGGPLVFVEVERRLSQAGALKAVEVQTLVYRQRTPVDPLSGGPAAPVEAQWRVEVRPDPVLLLRMSAATFNGHRIHYDRDFAVGTEGYPGLVVHGPYIALRLLEELTRRAAGRTVAEFSFRAARPLFDTAPFQICGAIEAGGARLWAQTADGAVAMLADVRFA